MALTTANAVKALIEGLGLGLTAYRDRAPTGMARPYVTINEQVALVPDRLEDGAISTAAETVAVDLWQDWRNLTTGAIAEDYTLASALERGLHGKRLALIGNAVTYAVLVRDSRRLLDEEPNIIHHALTLEVMREV